MAKDKALFVYGTLMEPAVLARLLKRVPDHRVAVLSGFRRFQVMGAVYPGIVSARGGSVTGVLLDGLREDELARLDAYEGGEYERLCVAVNPLNCTAEPAWVYCYTNPSRVTDDPWSAEHVIDCMDELGLDQI